MTLNGTIGFITHHDMRLMHRLQRWRAPRWVRLWMICATRGGDGWVWYGQALALLVFGGPSRAAAVASASLASALGILVFLELKKVIGRKRPVALEPHCWATLLPPDQFSFPSGHTITAFAVIVPIMLFYPHLTAFLLFLAISIALSRIVLGMHFLSDVLAGCLIGCCLGYGSFLLVSMV